MGRPLWHEGKMGEGRKRGGRKDERMTKKLGKRRSGGQHVERQMDGQEDGVVKEKCGDGF